MSARRFSGGLGLPVLAALLALTAYEREAFAAPCSTLPNPVVIESGDTQEPLLKALGRKLRDSAAKPMTVIYVTTGSCTLIDDMFNGRKLAPATNASYTPSLAEDPTWDPAKSPSPQCAVDAAGGLPVDIAISAVFVSACTQTAPPAGLGLVLGPIQAYAFIAPKASSQTAITAEEAYFAFGFGQLGMSQPWVDEASLFIRPPTKSTIVSLGNAIGVPPAKWKGVPKDKSAEVLNLVATSATPEKAIGILGAEIADANRDKVSVLAYRSYRQKYAFFPDSSATAFDKRNLRDGHYVPWSPTVYLTAVDGTGVPTGGNAKYFIDLVLGNPTTPTADVDGLSTVISKGIIPDCAMKVSRKFDGGNLSLYAPPATCACFYESKIPNSTTTCTACADDSPCMGGKCRRGVCEAR